MVWLWEEIYVKIDFFSTSKRNSTEYICAKKGEGVEAREENLLPLFLSHINVIDLKVPFCGFCVLKEKCFHMTPRGWFEMFLRLFGEEGMES